LVDLKDVLYKLIGNGVEDGGIKTYVGKDEEDFCFVRVSDPHLGAVDYPMVSVLVGACFKSEGI